MQLKSLPVLKLVVGGLIVATAALLVDFPWMYHSQPELPVFEGRLYPSNEAMPANACNDSVSENDLVVLLGTEAVRTDKFPLSLVKVGGRDRLVLDKAEDESILVSLAIQDGDGREIRMIKGKVAISNNHLPERRKDRNSLELTDSLGRQFLSMRYVNRNTLQVDAVLYYQGFESTPIILSGSTSRPTIGAHNAEIRGNCHRNKGIALVMGELGSGVLIFD